MTPELCPVLGEGQCYPWAYTFHNSQVELSLGSQALSLEWEEAVSGTAESAELTPQSLGQEGGTEAAKCRAVEWALGLRAGCY